MTGESVGLYLIVALIAAVLSVAAVMISRRRGLLAYPSGARPVGPMRREAPIGFWRFIGSAGFGVLGLTAIYGTITLVLSVLIGMEVLPQTPQEQLQIWLALVFPLVAPLLVGGYTYFLGPSVRDWLWEGRAWKTSKGLRPCWWRSAGVGALVLLVAWPLTQLVTASLSAFWLQLGFELTPQFAVTQLRGALGNPFMVTYMILVAVVTMPIAEEFVFRGLLQSWLRRHLDRQSTIFVTSLLFALLHLHWTQGITNLIVVPALFLFSSFLGFVFERERTLWAPITLHMLFNAVTVGLVMSGLVPE